MHLISDRKLSLTDLHEIVSKHPQIKLSGDTIQKIKNCRDYLDQKLKDASEPIYGINTGFGSLYNRNISSDQLDKLQENLVKSHACGTGPDVPQEIVRLMLFLKIQSLCYGYSGVQTITVERLTDLYN